MCFSFEVYILGKMPVLVNRLLLTCITNLLSQNRPSNFQDWICPYATLDSEDELHEINKLSTNIASFFTEKVDSAKIDREAKIDPTVMQVVHILLYV